MFSIKALTMSNSLFEKVKTLIEDLPYSHLSESVKRSMNRIRAHMAGRSVGFVTANRSTKPDPKNPTGEPLRVSKAENRSNNKALEKDIQDAGYSFIRVKGGWVETQSDGIKVPAREPSYLVVGPKEDDGGKLKEFLKHHGSKYNQDAVLYKPHNHPHIVAISTSDRNPNSPKHSEDSLGNFHPGRFGDYFTALHGDAHTAIDPKKMSREERRAHRQASLKQKTFVFESLTLEFSEDENAPVDTSDLTYYGRLAEHSRKNKEKQK